MSEKAKNKYINNKKQVFKELKIPLTEDHLARMDQCANEVQIDNIAHTVIMNHSYARQEVLGVLLPSWTPEDIVDSFQEALLRDWQNAVTEQELERYKNECEKAGLI